MRTRSIWDVQECVPLNWLGVGGVGQGMAVVKLLLSAPSSPGVARPPPPRPFSLPSVGPAGHPKVGEGYQGDEKPDETAW